MYTEAIVAIIIINYLRRTLRASGALAQWNRLLLIGLTASIALLIIPTMLDATRTICTWLTHALLLSLIYSIFTKSEFRIVKSLVYAVLPFMVISIVNDILELVHSEWAKAWDNYFDTAKFFAIVWMFAMWFITTRQRKALEKERLLAAEKEKEYKITALLKGELEVQVAERTAALTQQKEELQQTIQELKATQAQLIQSEKMASLGELTAGIAHEIQNPLNFVNNFSEVNIELIDEMQQEIQRGNLEAARTISNDIKDNEQKINHHGKRADGIVKGMLQHSRSSGGSKEPTDINVLADEYLRLAYHGLRAKDKSFNATMKTDFDTTIGMVNIIPQDIGRVILNLITNAFYSVAEKSKQIQNGEYEPTVSVSSRKINGTVELKIQDNGNGIPPHVMDKIFQPFFTTKPTGKGTGLGLSLSYEIVKAHGGQLKVQTKEGEFAEFIVLLPSES